MSNYKLPVTEELDFHYLLELMPALHDIDRFAWLPELFSIIGVEALLTLCKYAGGELIQVPTVEELKDSVDALQWFYDVHISKTKECQGIPSRLLELVSTIKEVFDAGGNQT